MELEKLLVDIKCDPYVRACCNGGQYKLRALYVAAQAVASGQSCPDAVRVTAEPFANCIGPSWSHSHWEEDRYVYPPSLSIEEAHDLLVQIAEYQRQRDERNAEYAAKKRAELAAWKKEMAAALAEGLVKYQNGQYFRKEYRRLKDGARTSKWCWVRPPSP